jgi:hypothetical protein
MSWKINLIVITNTNYVQLSEITEKIGRDNLNSKKTISMPQAQYEDKGVSIGKFEDKIFIVSQELVFDLLEKENTDIEKKILQSFPDSEIAVLTLGYGVHGYSIIRNKRIVRRKVGFDLKSSVDQGEKLPEEVEAYNEVSNNKELIDEVTEYSPNDLQGIINENAGEETVFKLTKRYFKQRIDEDGSNFDKITLFYYE